MAAGPVVEGARGHISKGLVELAASPVVQGAGGHIFWDCFVVVVTAVVVVTEVVGVAVLIL